MLENDQVFLKGVESFFAERKEDDLNVVELMRMYIEKFVSPSASKIFINDPSIKALNQANPDAQRLLINRYLKLLLLRYRAKTNIYVLHMLQLCYNEGELSEWFRYVETEICPFLKHNQVFNIVYGFGV